MAAGVIHKAFSSKLQDDHTTTQFCFPIQGFPSGQAPHGVDFFSLSFANLATEKLNSKAAHKTAEDVHVTDNNLVINTAGNTPEICDVPKPIYNRCYRV